MKLIPDVLATVPPLDVTGYTIYFLIIKRFFRPDNFKLTIVSFQLFNKTKRITCYFLAKQDRHKTNSGNKDPHRVSPLISDTVT